MRDVNDIVNMLHIIIGVSEGKLKKWIDQELYLEIMPKNFSKLMKPFNPRIKGQWTQVGEIKKKFTSTYNIVRPVKIEDKKF